MEGRPERPVGWAEEGWEGQTARLGTEPVHMVDLSGDWCRAAGAGCWVEGVGGGGGRLRASGGGVSGSVKSVCRLRSQRTAAEGREGAWFARAVERCPASRRLRKASEPSEQKV